ncbi:hypothetical protein B0H17DRAFT_129299 [Mycena rosella]|uniref:Uncharacterized protein n=1 Tax=Mycena rosella TaxID=1033263 RepID=A0AAD7D368_MYCRO|nr:hypothetical protein B0H17DRAFT_129299 [Mycena rosella]
MGFELLARDLIPLLPPGQDPPRAPSAPPPPPALPLSPPGSPPQEPSTPRLPPSPLPPSRGPPSLPSSFASTVSKLPRTPSSVPSTILNKTTSSGGLTLSSVHSTSAKTLASTLPASSSLTLPAPSYLSSTAQSASAGFTHARVLAGTLLPLLIIALVTTVVMHRRRRLRRERERTGLRADSDVELKSGPALPSEDAIDMAPSKSDAPQKSISVARQIQALASDKSDAVGEGSGSNAPTLSRTPSFPTSDCHIPSPPPPRYSRPLPRIPP